MSNNQKSKKSRRIKTVTNQRCLNIFSHHDPLSSSSYTTVLDYLSPFLLVSIIVSWKFQVLCECCYWSHSKFSLVMIDLVSYPVYCFSIFLVSVFLFFLCFLWILSSFSSYFIWGFCLCLNRGLIFIFDIEQQWYQTSDEICWLLITSGLHFWPTMNIIAIIRIMVIIIVTLISIKIVIIIIVATLLLVDVLFILIFLIPPLLC